MGANVIALSEPEEAPPGGNALFTLIKLKVESLQSVGGFYFYLAQLAVLEVTCPNSLFFDSNFNSASKYTDI